LAKEIPPNLFSFLQCRQLYSDAPEKNKNCKNINFKSTNYVKFKGDNEEREDCTYLEVGREVMADGWKPLIGLSPGSPWKLWQLALYKEDDTSAGAGILYTFRERKMMIERGSTDDDQFQFLTKNTCCNSDSIYIIYMCMAINSCNSIVWQV
jgi:hypothetical protein